MKNNFYYTYNTYYMYNKKIKTKLIKIHKIKYEKNFDLCK